MGSNELITLSSERGSWNVLSEEHSAQGKEDQKLIFRDELDEEGFPKVFFLRTQEVRMFLRIVQFFTCRLVWEKENVDPNFTLELLLGLQYIEWFENLSVTSTLFNEENLLLHSIWSTLFNLNGNLKENFRKFNALEFQKMINEKKDIYGHLTFIHYRSECKRDQFLNYIVEHLVSQRKLQLKNLNHTSHFKRSSDHSNSSRESSSVGFIPTAKVREFEIWELLELLKLSPHERKLQLFMGEIPEVS